MINFLAAAAVTVIGGMIDPGHPLPLGPPAGSHIISGNFTHYDQSPTDGTLDYRQSVGELPLDLSPYTVYLATIETCDKGATGWIRPVVDGVPGGWERFIVFDCPGSLDAVENFFRPNGIIAELDYYTALRWETIGHGIAGEIVWD